MGGKGPFSRPPQEYLVLYHLNRIIRYKKDEPLWPFCAGYLVLYHSLLLSPCFDIGVPAGKISGVFLNPGILGSLLSFLFTFGAGTCFLPLLYPVIGGKILPTEETLFGHRHTPLFLP